ncbi:MAG: ribosomal RNA small subunit methyltransferase A, partial [Nitrospinae bacterium]|nr:ribosomal RNA small subunit methyltransferase A [Nitrospinota bacterium]
MRKRPLGQNFLVDLHIAQNIIQLANIQPGEHVVEIGPGKGILTQLLINKVNSLTAVELDPRLAKDIQSRFGNTPTFKLIEGDAAKFDYASLGKGLNVVSNLPYYAATHIMKKLIHYRDHINS